MTDSLILAGQFELADVEDPAQQNYVLGGGYTFGDPIPIVATLQGLAVDGGVQSGKQSANRPMQLPIVVKATDRLSLTKAENRLLTAVDAATFTLQWTPDGGLPVIWDCFRVTQPTTTWDQRTEQVDARVVTLTFQARPFGRSPDAQVINAPAAQQQLDNFNAARTGGTLDTTKKYEGTGSNVTTLLRVASTSRFSNDGAPLTNSFAAKDLSAAGTVLQLAVMPNTLNPDLSASLTITVNLTSASGTTAFGVSGIIGPGQTFSAAAGFALPQIPLTGGTVTSGTGVDLTAVTSYVIIIKETVSTAGPSVTVNVDDLRALPSSSTAISTAHGSVLKIPGVLGSARAPARITATANPATVVSLLLHSPPPDQDADAQILIGLANIADQTIAVPTANAGFSGTYSLFLARTTAGISSSTETVTVTVTQKEGATVVDTKQVAATYVVGAGTKIIPVGIVTLPLRAIPADNTQTNYTFEVNSTVDAGSSDRFSDLMLCDTHGQTVVIDTGGTFRLYYYIDEPDAATGFGQVYTSAVDRTTAYGIPDKVTSYGGQFSFDPGLNKLLAVSPDAPISASVLLYPRWRGERDT